MVGLSWQAVIQAYTQSVPKNARLKYVVLDFETTGLSSSKDKIIEVGMVKCVGKEEIDTFSTFVDPETPLSPQITQITGITDAQLQNAPKIEDIAQQMYDFIGDHLIVAHNASFDIGFLRAAYRKNGITAPLRFVDTLSLSKVLFPEMENHKLCTLVDHFSIAACQTHRALDDARCAHQLFEICLSSMEKLPPSERAIFSIEKARPLKKEANIKLSDIQPTNTDMDPTHPLYGKTIVFTGELSMERRTAMQMAADVGAILKNNISRNTNYLVVGRQDPDLVGEDGMSTKQETALELNRSGKGHVNVIQEAEFLALLKKEPPAPAEEEKELTLQ